MRVKRLISPLVFALSTSFMNNAVLSPIINKQLAQYSEAKIVDNKQSTLPVSHITYKILFANRTQHVFVALVAGSEHSISSNNDTFYFLNTHLATSAI